MNILVTGANGQLGSEVRIVSKGSTDNYIFTDVAELDITNKNSIESFVNKNAIGVVINCAAYTNVDKAEEDKDLAKILNTDAVEYLAEIMKSVNGLLIHISTDYVFGTEPYNTPCKESQIGTPTGVYGVTKLMGERAIINTSCKYIIIRTAWLYSEYGDNFVKTMMSLTSSKPQLNVVFDQVGTPTYAYDLASVIFQILENRMSEGNDGIYHFSNEGVCSWYDFTKEIASLSGNMNCIINPCHSDEFPSKVIRPSYSVLDKTKIKETFGIKIPYWKDSLSKSLFKNI